MLQQIALANVDEVNWFLDQVKLIEGRAAWVAACCIVKEHQDRQPSASVDVDSLLNEVIERVQAPNWKDVESLSAAPIYYSVTVDPN